MGPYRAQNDECHFFITNDRRDDRVKMLPRASIGLASGSGDASDGISSSSPTEDCDSVCEGSDQPRSRLSVVLALISDSPLLLIFEPVNTDFSALLLLFKAGASPATGSCGAELRFGGALSGPAEGSGGFPGGSTERVLLSSPPPAGGILGKVGAE